MRMRILIGAATVAGLFAGNPVSANAAVYDFKFTDTISFANTPGVAVGDTFTLHLFADNGGSSLISQTWNYADLQGFTIQAGSYHASYSKVFESPATGNFQTDALGQVSAVQFYGTSNASNNTDNFGSWAGDVVFGNASFNDFLGRSNGIAANTFTTPGEWTVSAAVGAPAPIPGAGLASLAAMAIGAFRARKRRA
jgi:hypothetical protein